MREFGEHLECVYSVAWHPSDTRLFASVAGDCLLKLWSTGEQNSLITIPAHSHPILSVDFCKYGSNILATASTDGQIKCWDIRQPLMPVQTLLGHRMGVRRVRWSPFDERLLASCGYDMSVRVWDAVEGRCLRDIQDIHSEFTFGVDWSLHERGLLASCSWDQSVCLSQI